MDLGEVAFRISVLGEDEARRAMEDHIRDQDRVVQAMDDSARAAVRAAEIRERAIQRELKSYDDLVREVKSIERAYQTLAASFDPLNKAQLQYQRGMEVLQKALDEQIITDKQYQRTLKDLETQMERTVAAEKLRQAQVIANEEKRTAAALEQTSRAYDRLVASLDPVAAAESRYTSAVEVANKALEDKIIAQEEYNRVVGLAEMQRATTLTKIAEQADREAASAKRESSNETRRLEAELATFTATVSQTERAQQMYARAQDLTTRAVERGIITQDRANAIMAETQFRIQSMGHYVNDMGQVLSRSDSAWSRWARGGIQQAGYQVSDFFIQMQMGTPIATALGQQGSQLLGSFGQWGAMLGGLLAVGAATYTIWNQMAGSAETLEDRLKNVGEAASEASQSLDKIDDMSFDGMFDGLKVSAADIRNEFSMLLDMMTEVEERSLQMRLETIRSASGLEDYLRSYRMRNSILQQTGSGEAEFDYMGLENEFQGRYVNRALSEIGGTTREEILATVEAAREKLEIIGYLTPAVQEYLAEVASELGIQKLVNEEQKKVNERQKEYTDLVKQTRSTMGEFIAERAAAEKKADEEHKARIIEIRGIMGQFLAERKAAEEEAARKSDEYIANYIRLVTEPAIAEAEKNREAAAEAVLDLQREMESVMNTIANMNLSAPFINMLGPIQNAINKAKELSNYNGMTSGPEGPKKVPSGLGGEVDILYGNVPPALGGGVDMPTSTRPQAPPQGIGGVDWGSGSAGGGGGGAGSEDALKRLREQIKLEAELLGQTEAYARVVRALGDDRQKYSDQEIAAVVREIEMLELKKVAIDQVNQITSTMQSSLEQGFMAMMSGTESVEDAFKKMAYNIIQELYRVLVVQQIVGSWNAQTGTGSGIVGWVGKLLGGVFANGAAFSGGRVTAFADGGVVTQPSLFPMQNGLGLMGEAGPEAIMPLSRTADGRLGVQVAGSASTGGDVTVVNNINVPAGATSEAVRAEVVRMLPTITDATTAAVVRARQRGGSMRDAFRS